jgi:hypothetical protein
MARYGLRLERGRRRKAAVPRLNALWRVYEAAQSLRGEEGAWAKVAMKRKEAEVAGDRESGALWDRVGACLNVSAEKIVAVRDDPKTVSTFRLEVD